MPHMATQVFDHVAIQFFPERIGWAGPAYHVESREDGFCRSLLRFDANDIPSRFQKAEDDVW